MSVVVGNWLVDVVSSVVFDALNGQADAAPAKASNANKLKTNVRTMIRPSPLVDGLISKAGTLTPPARGEKRYFDGQPGDSPGFGPSDRGFCPISAP